MEINLMSEYPRSQRPVEERGEVITEEHRSRAREFGASFFDGDRLEGYGGYSYDPKYWTRTVKLMSDYYGINHNSKILDVGCGKGFMLHDFRLLHPGIKVTGIDISRYAVHNAMKGIGDRLWIGSAADLPYSTSSFDLVISINTIHNLPLEECKEAIREIERVSRGNSFIMVDAWRTEEGRRNLGMWNLTAQTYMHTDDWTQLLHECGYTGDWYYFMIGDE